MSVHGLWQSVFLPLFDNVLLSHADRTRVISDEHRKAIAKDRRALGTVLVDGFVGGTWKAEQTRQRKAMLLIEPFEPLPKGDRDALAEEGERLIHFVGEGA